LLKFLFELFLPVLSVVPSASPIESTDLPIDDLVPICRRGPADIALVSIIERERQFPQRPDLCCICIVKQAALLLMLNKLLEFLGGPLRIVNRDNIDAEDAARLEKT
jgi:hypothetical protein